MVLRIAFATALAAAALAAAGGGAVFEPLHVSATVRPSAVLRLEARAANVSVSESDIARGYLDVPADALLRIDTGRLRPQVAAELPPEGGPFSSVEVLTTAALVYRFTFSAKVTPGSYRVPLTLSIGL